MLVNQGKITNYVNLIFGNRFLNKKSNLSMPRLLKMLGADERIRSKPAVLLIKTVY